MPPFVCIQTAFCYIMESLKQMPFANLTNSEIIGLFAEHSQSFDPKVNNSRVAVLKSVDIKDDLGHFMSSEQHVDGCI